MWTYILIHTYGHTQSYKHTNKIANLQKIKRGDWGLISTSLRVEPNTCFFVIVLLHYCTGSVNAVSLGMRTDSRPASGWWKLRFLFCFLGRLCITSLCCEKRLADAAQGRGRVSWPTCAQVASAWEEPSGGAWLVPGDRGIRGRHFTG